eukprot:1082086-Pyramimonas_sp.AAC.1
MWIAKPSGGQTVYDVSLALGYAWRRTPGSVPYLDRQHRSNGRHPLVEDVLGNVVSLLSTAKVLRIPSRRV